MAKIKDHIPGSAPSSLRGRPPKSDEEKKRRGTFKPSRSYGDEPPPPNAPKKPRGRPRKNVKLDKQDPQKEAEKIFAEASNVMTAYKTIHAIDYHFIAIMANEYKKYIDMSAKDGIEVNEFGMTSVSAAARLSKIHLDNMLKVAAQLGVTAVMRMRVRIKDDEQDEDDPLQKLLKSANPST